MGQAALAFRRAARHAGYWGDVYAAEVTGGFSSLVQSVDALRPSPDDVVLYHHGIASELASRLMHLPCKRGLVFHNITPHQPYAGTRLEEALRTGRSQLSALARHVDVGIGVSDYNAAELRACGFSRVETVPLVVEPARFERGEADLRLLKKLRGLGSPLLLTVGRVVPHKRLPDVLALFAEVKLLAPDAALVIVGASDDGHRPTRELKAEAATLQGVHFAGRLSHAELVAAYRAADAYVSMSEHEGVGVPLLEAMASDVPVYAFGAAAVPETMGGRGITFDEKHFAGLAEVLVQIEANEALRRAIVEGQRERLAAYSLEATASALRAALGPLEPPRPTSRPRRRTRMAVVVQRYGEGIVGGAEAHARQVVRHLKNDVDIEVLTTCAIDHLTWANALPAGLDECDGVPVRRFATTRARSMGPFNALSKGRFASAQALAHEEHWVAEQGPLAPALFEAVLEPQYDVVTFFTYLYAPTVWGVPLVGPRAIVVPTAHDEPPLGFHLYADVFTRPQALLCNTPEEAELIARTFPQHAPMRVVGVGIEPGAGDAEAFAERHGLHAPYLLYVGRLEAGKGVPELLALYRAMQSRYHDAPELVLCGQGELGRLPPGVRALGRVSEEDKWGALKGALAVVVPSKLESLSLLALEAFAAGTPVLGNGRSEVVAGQLRRSGGGLTYMELRSFIDGVRRLGAERAPFAAAGRRFAKGHGWPKVTQAWLEAIARARIGAR